MNGVVQFIRSLVFVAILLGAAGTLVEATGCVGREAAKACGSSNSNLGRNWD